MGRKANIWGKTNMDGHLTIHGPGGWTWVVLKSYTNADAEVANKYARWFCRVTSPLTQGGSDMGDVYILDIVDVLPEQQKRELGRIMAMRAKVESGEATVNEAARV
jgi:hypothetical protein